MLQEKLSEILRRASAPLDDEAEGEIVTLTRAFPPSPLDDPAVRSLLETRRADCLGHQITECANGDTLLIARFRTPERGRAA
ncbi:MAG: hypothetical protein D6773_11895 [Alphaproteobacteria bacterium]|nr:MAG: hypothetical protein D6773_11895 [Alphaproteobacteria bacterium]